MVEKAIKKILSKKEPEKRLILRFKKTGGRARNGRVTVRFRGGGARKLYRFIDFGQEKIDILGKVISLEYDPNRFAVLALVEYQDKDKRYILAPNNLKIGDEVLISEKAPIKIGNRLKLKDIPEGTMVYNIELEPNRGGKLVRSAGNSALVIAHEAGYCHLKMPSSELRKVSDECWASVGEVSNPEHKFEIIGKAGSRRLKGRKPHVRGSAMNPCDHPHGGGEGKTPIGLRYPKTPWGKPARGVKTRKKKWTNKLIINRRKKK